MKIALINLIALISKKAPISKLKFGIYLGQLSPPRRDPVRKLSAGEIRLIRNLLVLILYTLYLILNTSTVLAANFSEAYIRLDRLKANTSLAGLVCAKPATTATEAKVSITFPSDFTISGSTSNWTTSTSNLPSGATAWSGIGSSASNVSGQTVTFSSSDLSVGTLYCFSFSSSSSSTGSAGEKTGIIATKNSSDSTIDSTNYGMTIVANDQITVTASITPSIFDFQNSLSSPTNSEVSQDKEVEYKITYGLNSTSSSDITLEAQWYKGTIEGEGSESVDIVEYVVGSAGKAYSSTNPVIDTVNRKITWTISSFPGGTTDQTATFKLRTTGNYTGDKKVSFKVSSRIISGSTTTTDSTITKNYKYSPSIVKTTATPTPTPTPSAQPPLRIEGVEIREIANDSATIFVSTSKGSSIRVSYGETQNRLTSSLISGGLSTLHLINLGNLKADSAYFFRITATDSGGQQLSSDIFTFKTAQSSETPKIDQKTLVVTSGNNIIHDSQTSKREKVLTILPKNKDFQFKFALSGDIPAKKVEAIVRNKNILGFSTFAFTEASANTEIAEVLEIEPNVYLGRLKTKPVPGIYEVYIRITDYSGNISEHKLIEIKVTNPFTVLSRKDGTPLDGTHVLLYHFNLKNRRFEIISQNFLAIANPSFTNGAGEVDLSLPFGKYKAELSNLGFKEKEIEFTLGEGSSDGYPIAYMDEEDFNLFNTVIYYGRSFRDVFLVTTYQYIAILSSSIRFFNLLSSVVAGSLVLITLFAFSKKHGIPLSSLHSNFLFLLHRSIKPKTKNYISGIVSDENENPLPSANVYLLSEGVEEIIGKTQTNRKGEFFFRARRSLGEGGYLIMAMKEGYKTHPLLPFNKSGEEFKIVVSQNLTHRHSPIHYLKHLIEGGIGIYFEALLLFSFFFEVLFIQAFGFQKAIPFVSISLFNLFFWLLFIHHHRKNPSI